jgi:hypothetical protein
MPRASSGTPAPQNNHTAKDGGLFTGEIYEIPAHNHRTMADFLVAHRQDVNVLVVVRTDRALRIWKFSDERKVVLRAQVVGVLVWYS